RVLLAPHRRDGADHRRRVRVADTVVNPQPASGRVDLAQGRQLPRPVSRTLTVVPGYDPLLLDVRFLDRLGQTVIVDQFGVAVVAQQQVAAKPAAETEGIDE